MSEAFERAAAKVAELDAQVRVEVIPGVFLRKKENGIQVLTIHYSADPARNPDTEEGAEWYKREKRNYSSDSAWKREQEIDDLAGGGERVFANVLDKHFDKVVITDPNWQPDPRWDVVFGFDHGKVNATALEKIYVDFQGRIYFCGEYYSMKRPGWDNEVWQNAPEIQKMPDLNRMRWCQADPSIFPDSQVQADGKMSSINKSYIKNGITFLKEYSGERSDIAFVEYMLSTYWKDLENREPLAFIVCRNQSDRIQPGLHPYDSPNLLWELQRSRRAELTARQMMVKNPTEKIIDKNNHARDGAKYAVFTLKKPTEKSQEDELKAVVNGLNPTSAQIAAQRWWAEQQKKRHGGARSINFKHKARMR